MRELSLNKKGNDSCLSLIQDVAQQRVQRDYRLNGYPIRLAIRIQSGTCLSALDHLIMDILGDMHRGA